MLDSVSKNEENVTHSSINNSEIEICKQRFEIKSVKKASPPNWFLRKVNYGVFLYICIFMNYDTGVIPSAATMIQDDLDIDYSHLAALGTFVNFGIGCACLFVSFFFYKFQLKWVLIVSLFINSGFCVLFAFSFNLYSLYITRILMGITQAFWIVYGPVWINNFSPAEFQTTWIGIFQGFSPLGIIIGYGTTALITNISSSSYSWRFSIMVQAFGQLLPILIFFFMENKEIDIIRTDQIENEDIEEFQLKNFSDVADKIGV